jgi:uncharacterized protein (DUF2252 family)
MNVLKRIQKANQGRDPMRLAMKYRTMRNTPFGFMRGSCHLFNARLVEQGVDVRAPSAWSCGDLHLENFGSYKGDNRQVYFDINDFDEAALAPAIWDLVRLATSIHAAFHVQASPGTPIDALVGRLIASYAAALADGEAGWIERETAHGAARQVLDHLQLHSRDEFLDSRTRIVRHRRQLLVDGTHMLAVSDAERELVSAFMREFAASQADATPSDYYRVLDVASRVAGTGSLGMMRYVVLVEGKDNGKGKGKGKGKDKGSLDHNVLFDLKQARPSTLGRLFKARQPRWHGDAERIVAAQRQMQAVATAGLHAVTLDGQPFVLRSLAPSEDRLPQSRLREDDALAACAIDVMGRCLAWTQLRSAGWQGAADAKALAAFARQQDWQSAVAQAAAGQARQVLLDWETFATAYDAGKLPLAAGID